jgi:signal transduction histidine kinase
LLETQINTASQQLRQLITDLRPPVSDDGTFDSILKNQIEIHQQRGGSPVNLIKPDGLTLSHEKKLALSRIIQEILLNIRKHAQASRVDITLEIKETALKLTVTDDGIGFDDALVPNPLAESGGAGMVNMYIRASAVGGKFDVKSHPGQGTTIWVDMPL